MSPLLTSGDVIQYLINDGCIDEAQLHQAVALAKQHNINLIPYLITHVLIDADHIAYILSQCHNCPLFNLNQLTVSELPHSLLTQEIIEQYRGLPLSIHPADPNLKGKIVIALSDTAQITELSDFCLQHHLILQPVIVNHHQLETMLTLINLDETDNHISPDTPPMNLNNTNTKQLTTPPTLDTETTASNLSASAREMPDTNSVINLVDQLLRRAIHMGASDLHFEPYENVYRVRFRIDGIMHKVAEPLSLLAPKIAARLKVMSKMDISERRIPQDGRIKLTLTDHQTIDFRVNSLPTLFGEKIVLRLLDPTSAAIGIDSLGFEPEQKALFLQALNRPQGMILITGPTGSGKTVSLYTALNILNTTRTNISTVEDPVELNLTGINQVNVNSKVGLSFASALKAFLRQDPDILMVGEIRDLETADTAMKAAQTGHLVLSTLHTNSAAETLTRLHHMGVARFNIASAVSLVVAQRLARRLCEHCKQPTQLPKQSLLNMGFSMNDLESSNKTVYDAIGCDQCFDGYKGRVGIYEVMPINKELSHLMIQGGHAPELKMAAELHGFKDLRRSGILKVQQGITSAQEMFRVT